MLPKEINLSLENLQKFLCKKPKSIHEAMKYELEKQFILHGIQFAKGKLISDINDKHMRSISSLKELSNKVDEHKDHKESTDDMLLLDKLYK